MAPDLVPGETYKVPETEQEEEDEVEEISDFEEQSGIEQEQEEEISECDELSKVKQDEEEIEEISEFEELSDDDEQEKEDLVEQAGTDALLIAQFKAVHISKVRAAGGTIVTLLRCLRFISTNNSKLKQRRRLLLMLLGQRNPTLLLRNYLPKVKQAELHMLVAKLES